MARTILLSVHPEFVAKILQGIKSYEFRRVVPKNDVSGVLIYCTAPVKRVVAFVEVTGCLSGSPTEIWNATAARAGISRAGYRTYFRGRRTAHAFVIGRVCAFERPCELREILPIRVPPQSFCYVDERVAAAIKERMVCHRMETLRSGQR